MADIRRENLQVYNRELFYAKKEIKLMMNKSLYQILEGAEEYMNNYD